MLWSDSKSRSRELWERGKKVCPGGFSNLNLWPGEPVYVARGEGAKVWDVDGVERLDFTSNYTTTIHGHGHPAIMEAVLGQVERGLCFSFFTEEELKLAELLCNRFASVERVKFANTGTAAGMMAVKAAYAFTGKTQIAKLEGVYHGSYDRLELSVSSAPENWGADPRRPNTVAYCKNTPSSMLSESLVIPFNDVEAAETLLQEHGDELAAVFLDLNPMRCGYRKISPEFLGMLRRVTRDLGALLVYDEVISLRTAYGGAQSRYQEAPDLTMMGKIIGGGFPIGAVGGRADVMEVFDQCKTGWPDVPIFGTFTANPISMVAGVASMTALTREAIDRINSLGERLREGVNRVAEEVGVEAHATGVGSLFSIHMTRRPIVDYRSYNPHTQAEADAKTWIQRFMLENGFLFGQPLTGCISTPMTTEDVDALVDTVGKALRAYSNAH